MIEHYNVSSNRPFLKYYQKLIGLQMLGDSLLPIGDRIWPTSSISIGSFEPGIYAIGNVGNLTEAGFQTNGFGLLIVLSGYNNKKYFIAADCQLGGGIKSGMA